MNFYYDITLDFLENSYLFYEVCKIDKFTFVKKIPLFQVNNKVLKDFLLNKVKVDNAFLKLLENKTITKNEVIPYACILADKNNAVGFIFNKDGVVTKYSSLSLLDEINLLEVIYTVKSIDINYEILEKNKINCQNRNAENIKNIIMKEIDKLYQEKNQSKLQFLYLEWFNNYEDDFNKMYKQMKAKVNEEITLTEERIAKIIEMSYNNV